MRFHPQADCRGGQDRHRTQEAFETFEENAQLDPGPFGTGDNT